MLQYFEPNFIEEALVVLDRFGPGARVLAGGTLLGPRLRSGHDAGDALMNVKRIAALRGVSSEAEHLRIGAAVTAAELARHDLVRQRSPLLAAAARTVGARQIRTSATIGGNLCSGLANADLSTALVACDARVVLAASHEVHRTIGVERFLAAPSRELDGALLVAVEVPHQLGSHAFVKMQTRRAFEMALVSAAVALRIDSGVVEGTRIALGGAAAVPVNAVAAAAALTGRRFDARTLGECATRAAEVDASPNDDSFSSAFYRRHLVRTLVERALREAGHDALASAI